MTHIINTQGAPFETFQNWLAEAETLEHSYPNAFSFASVNKNNQPSVRTLLLKGLDDRGFVFYTNTQSRKGDDIRDHAFGAMLFYWKTLMRQVRIEGAIESVTTGEADAYFATRPRESQIGAWASQQSKPLAAYDDLKNTVAEYTTKFNKMDSIPRPPHWSGYRVLPETIEFWIEGEFRLHQRFLYTKIGTGWTLTLLNP